MSELFCIVHSDVSWLQKNTSLYFQLHKCNLFDRTNIRGGSSFFDSILYLTYFDAFECHNSCNFSFDKVFCTFSRFLKIPSDSNHNFFLQQYSLRYLWHMQRFLFKFQRRSHLTRKYAIEHKNLNRVVMEG